jgi:two-component system sensor histidine kinase KdpD
VTDEISPDSAQTPPPTPSQERHGKRGKLRVFLGIGPGVGKTAAMLQAALLEKLAGRHVLVGAVNRQGARATNALLRRLPWVRHEDDGPGGEMDLDATLRRRPDIVVVDELARSNSAGSRHPGRFQDVLELLESGIDVYTTLNIYEVTSRADLLPQIAGISSHNIVPDCILDHAAIDLVDLPAEELIRRLRHGEIRLPEDGNLARSRFFEKANLMTLREMAARFYAERVAIDAQELRQASDLRSPVNSNHRLLVAVESDWDAETLIQWTGRLAGSLNAPWIVLYVETPRGATLEEESRLTRDLESARKMGADVVTTTDADFERATLRVAVNRNITQIIVGKPMQYPWWKPFRRCTTMARLVRESSGIAVQVVPIKQRFLWTPARPILSGSNWPQYLLVAGTMVLVTLAGFWFTKWFNPHATALLYLLTVVILVGFVERSAILVAAALSALSWDYFFLPPVFAFRVSHFEDAMLLAMYFVVALVLGHLTVRIRDHEEGERQRERRTTALYLLTRELAEAITLDEIVSKVIEAMERAFDAEVLVLLADDAGHLQFRTPGSPAPGEKERGVAAWVLEHRQPAGKFTGNLPLVESMFVPLVSRTGALGVMGLRLRQSFPPTIHQQSLLDSLTRQIALSLDRQRLSELSRRTSLIVESERLSKMLLDSISHEIRTPLAAIESATGSLEQLGHCSGSGAEMITEIREATGRLNRLVGKVLDITRIEAGLVEPSLTECDVCEIVRFALVGTKRELARHKVSVEMADALPMVLLDFSFLQEALMNLLSNAAHHTPAGTVVEVRVWSSESMLFLTVSDRGPGIFPECLPRIFEKFYRGPAAPTGGTGLGLSLVKGFVEALGGTVAAINRIGGGTEFTVRLPVKQVRSSRPVAI